MWLEANQSLKNWNDPVARHQIINQVIFEECVREDGNRIWTKKASKKLEHFGISMAPSTLMGYRYSIISGKRSAETTSSFKKVEFGSRTNKFNVYGTLDYIVKRHLNNPRYIGLPANQLVHIIQKYGDSSIICERDKKTFEFLNNLKMFFAPESRATIINEDIISYINKTDNKFSLYDLDLMSHLTEDLIYKIVEGISNSSKQKSVVSIISCIGRKITEKKYKTIIPNLINGLKQNDFRIIEEYSNGYGDRITPMRYEFLVINRE